MAIEGPLRELALTDVVQLVSLSRKTGTLSVRAERDARPGLLYFDQGAVVGARAPGESSRLGRLLLMAGRVTAAQLDAALVLQRRAPGRRLGALLVETQGVAAQDVQKQLHFQVEETLFELIRWTDGFFRFEESAPLDPGPIRIRLPAESLLMEVLRRLDEWSELASGSVDTLLVPRLIEVGGTGDGVLQLLPPEWEVLAAVDGERTLQGIARELGRAEFDVAKAVFALASSGVVELSNRRRRRTPSPAATGLVEELQALEAELRAGGLPEVEHRLAELERRFPGRAEVQVLRGRLLGRQGMWAAAAEALESAVRLDPLLAPAYYHLGWAALRAGALARAEEALDACVRLPDIAEQHRQDAARAASLLAELRRLLEEVEG